MPVKQQPPIKVGDLIEGAKYRLRVYSHEHHDISSESFTFETGTGETTPLGAVMATAACRPQRDAVGRRASALTWIIFFPREEK